MKALHIDGEPHAGFSINRGSYADFVTYVTFGWAGDDPAALVRRAHAVVDKIERLSYENGSGEAPVIFWRRRMECVYETPDFAPGGRWVVSFRLAAVPQLTNEQWASLDFKPEGEAPKVLV